MSDRQVLSWIIAAVCSVLIWGVSMNAAAGLLGFGGDTWKEEVLLHDRSKIVVERMVERGGRHEVGQKPPIKTQSLRFTLPSSNRTIIWEDPYSQDLGQANFLPMALDISGGTPYLVVYPMGCLSYNKWGRPNPPYVIFQHQDDEWKRIPLQELPTNIAGPNMIFSMPDVVVEKFGKRFITADMIKGVIDGYQQPEFKTILREPMKRGAEGSAVNCEEMIHYKCGWISSEGTFGKDFMDQTCK